MHLLFLIPLTTAIVSGYLFNKATDEIADLTGLVAVFSLILFLVLAPWQLQLLVLLLVLSSTRRLLLRNEYRMLIQEDQLQQQNKSSVRDWFYSHE
jgi:prepilin signal peptidase PulO-like enzyme (type II secretory pathway)